MEKKSYLILYLLLFTSYPVYAHQEYVYPIAQINENIVMMIHQKSYDDLELLLWDRHEGTACRELTSMYIPSCVQLLPSKKAFSFIDRGRVRIKSFSKRTPRAIDIYEPIYAIYSMQWLTDDEFYFVGKNYGKLSIFLCDTSDRGAVIFSLTPHNELDYMYPCKVEDSLFCIAKDTTLTYSIVTLLWAPTLYEHTPYEHTSYEHSQHVQKLIISHDKPLCFLHMDSKTSGFVLECLDQQLTNDFLHFSCCSVHYENDTWNLTKLFEFKIPSKFLIGSNEDKVYETLIPFLPRYTPEWIYFANYDDESENCIIQRYNHAHNTIEFVTDTSRSLADFNHVFSPLIINDTLYCGFLFSEKMPSAFRNSCRHFLHIDETTGSIFCKLPQVSLVAVDRPCGKFG
ncbi:MAG TPA: hypothetical protein VLG50_03525 [Candidatus Saccharimonadales bacterium]|nr:hypothetical protein [Candidatus Saccharimonadales bacterium]